MIQLMCRDVLSFLIYMWIYNGYYFKIQLAFGLSVRIVLLDPCNILHLVCEVILVPRYVRLFCEISTI